jgi:uncharacterized LabA/DUF88 family protein
MADVIDMRSRRVFVAVDGQNLLAAVREEGYDGIAANAFARWAESQGSPTIVWFQGAHRGTSRFFEELRSAGIEVCTKEAVEQPGGNFKADMDIELAVRVCDEADFFGKVLLVSGDGDFVPVVRRLQDRGVRPLLLSAADRTARLLKATIGWEDRMELRHVLPSFGVRRVEAA